MAAYQRTLELTESRQQLLHHRDYDPRPYVRERCAVLLKIVDGTISHAVARYGLLKPRKPDTVYGWIDWYDKIGIRSVIWFQHAVPIGGHFDRTEEIQERLR